MKAETKSGITIHTTEVILVRAKKVIPTLTHLPILVQFPV